MKAMKRNIILRALATLIFVAIYSSCSKDRLDIIPKNQSEADYFKNELEFKGALLGVYAKLSDHYWYGANNPIHKVWLLPGDDLTTLGDIPFEVFTTLNSGDRDVSTYYRVAYQLINRANIVIQKLDDEEISSVITTPDLKDQLRGQALFLRGFMNMQLWNYFGTSPLIDERIVSADDILPPGSEGTELLDQAITDFQMAAGLLPTSWAASDRGRATKNSAYGMLGKALVFRANWTGNTADYTAAIDAFGKLSGLSLIADFADNFSVSAENNSESLFEYQASDPGFDNVWLANDFNQAIGSFSAYYGYFNDHWSFWAHTPYYASQKLVNAFEAGDPRADATFDAGNSRIKKYVTMDQNTSSGVASFNNPRILRYADVLLLWAEALIETDNANGAIAKINEVRTRARNMVAGGTIPADRATGANKATVRTWIQDERFVELAAEEGHRWLDLRRWHKAGHINLDSWDFSSDKTNFDIELPKNLLYPIPTSETDRNPNVLQNEGY
jgi:hypothetical protein